MTLRYLLDTNICIYMAKGKSERILKRFQELRTGEVGMSIITFGELYYGAKKSNQSKKALEILNKLAEIIPPYEMISTTSEIYGELRMQLEKKGQIIGNNDLWIAAHALSLKTTLVTNNEREFRRIKNLSVENWV